MGYGDEIGPEPRIPFSGLQKVLMGAIAVLLGLLVGVVVFSLAHRGDEIASVATARRSRPVHRELRHPPTKTSLPPATAGSNGTTPPHAAAGPSGAAGSSSPVLAASSEASFSSLAASLPASIGLAVAPLGAGSPQQLGDLQIGHAWSSIKVPILVTLMRDRGSSGLTAEEEQWAAAALTASDNSAAAALFQQLEQIHGGVSGASLAVQQVLAESGDTATTVATQPPPSGAVSTFGQTEWSLEGSVDFYRALACRRLLDPSQTEYVLNLMEQVISEQRWGLGEAGFPADVRVAFKAGWGPEGSSSGPYLVRQAGILLKGDSGVVVTMMAEDESGSFEAGVSDLNQIAAWLREHLGSLNTGACA